MKACENCSAGGDRVSFREDYEQRSFFTKFLGTALIYLPLLTMPFVLLSAYITYVHLKLVGAKNIRPLSSFLPASGSHRYNLKTQITMEPGYFFSPAQSKLFWILNCTWYCPVSVGLFEWHAYLVKVVENWWCPFQHGRKNPHYQEGAIDKSFWHLYPEVVRLDPADRDNPLWNAAAKPAEAQE